ncbi:MAG: Clp protease N-terminal domain-containing protein [candidate division Zixibacteria bacterium]|nr:Clp protease N-terminal domain-containing protein [candidate division Zixibacteria bacterium]
MDIASYSADSRAVIKIAREVAAEFRHPEITVEHLLIAVVRHEGSEVESILNQLGKSPTIVASMVETFLKDQSNRSTARENVNVAPEVQEVLNQALEEKAKLYDALVEPEHILLAIFDPKTALTPQVREKIDITKEDIYKSIADAKSVEEIASTSAPSGKGAVGTDGKKEVAGTLRYCIDLTNQAAAGEFDPMIGREDELQQLIQILLRRRKNSPVLVGGAGVGKTAIVEGVSQAVIDGRIPEKLKNIKVMEVDMGSLVAGAKYKGEFEERFKSLISEVVKSGGQIVLFIDEIHTLTGAGGGSGGMDAANLVKPALARGQIRLIGATTEEEYTKYLEKDKALDRRFERVKVEEPGLNDAVRIVKGVMSKYEEHHKIEYTEDALVGSVKYAIRYLSERNLPDIALDIVDEAASSYSVKKETAKQIIPEMEEQIGEIEKLITICDGKNPEKYPNEFTKLNESYEQFSHRFERLKDMWGHRLETAEGAE